MKGHTKIELTDVNTGKVEVVEEDNLITNAAARYISLCTTKYTNGGKVDINNDGAFPLYDNAFGGIKLFGGTITEDPENYNLPNIGTSPIIGYASSDTTPGTDPMRGSRNKIETKELDNNSGMQIVWDFATSEANGQIACVCLTSRLGGQCVYCHPTKLIRNVTRIETPSGSGYYHLIVDYNSETETIKTIEKRSDKKCILGEWRLPLFNMRLNDIWGEYNHVNVTEPVDVDFAFTGPRIDFQGSLYNVKGYNPYTLTKFNMQTKEVTEIVIDTPNIEIVEDSYYNAFFSIRDGYLFVFKKGFNAYYRIDLSNHSKVKEIPIPKMGSYNYRSHHISAIDNGNVLIDGVLSDPNTGEFVIVDPDYNTSNGSVYTDYVTTEYDPSRHDFLDARNCIQIVTKLWNRNVDSNVYIDENALMSINNLQTPVVKTADKTMKITYTLLYENEVTV